MQQNVVLKISVKKRKRVKKIIVLKMQTKLC